MTVDGRFSRRDFLRLRTTERGRLLEVSCRTLFMRCADATIVLANPSPRIYELLLVTNVITIFNIFDSEAEAIASFAVAA